MHISDHWGDIGNCILFALPGGVGATEIVVDESDLVVEVEDLVRVGEVDGGGAGEADACVEAECAAHETVAVFLRVQSEADAGFWQSKNGASITLLTVI